MILYHTTNKKLTKLIPQFGPTRHEAEDFGSIGKKVIFLSTTKMLRSTGEGLQRYCYSVSINDSDPLLKKDEDFSNGSNACQKYFCDSTKIGTEWYYYECEELDIIETYEFDELANDFVKIDNF